MRLAELPGEQQPAGQVHAVHPRTLRPTPTPYPLTGEASAAGGTAS